MTNRIASGCCCVSKDDDPTCENPFDLDECCGVAETYTVQSPFGLGEYQVTVDTFEITMQVGQYAADEFYQVNESFTDYPTYCTGKVCKVPGTSGYYGYSANYPVPASEINPTTGIISAKWQIYLQMGVTQTVTTSLAGNVYDQFRMTMSGGLAAHAITVEMNASSATSGVSGWRWRANGYVGQGQNVDYCAECLDGVNTTECLLERYICPADRVWSAGLDPVSAYHYGAPFCTCSLQQQHEGGCLPPQAYLQPQFQRDLGCCALSPCGPCNPVPDVDYGEACTLCNAGHIQPGFQPASHVGDPNWAGCQYTNGEVDCGRNNLKPGSITFS